MHRRVDPNDDGDDQFYIGIDTDIEDAMSVDVLGDSIYLWDRRVRSTTHNDRSFTVGYLSEPDVLETLLAMVNKRW